MKNSLSSLARSVDFFSDRITMYYNKQTSLSFLVSKLCSLLVIVILLIYSNFLLDNMSQYPNVQPSIQINPSGFSISLSSNNYLLSAGIIINAASMNASNAYFTFDFYYNDSNGNYQNLGLKVCDDEFSKSLNITQFCPSETFDLDVIGLKNAFTTKSQNIYVDVIECANSSVITCANDLNEVSRWIDNGLISLNLYISEQNFNATNIDSPFFQSNTNIQAPFAHNLLENQIICYDSIRERKSSPSPIVKFFSLNFLWRKNFL